jgi:threonylcarbamoyladenosine tRNA methylthiotransferase MtaB
MATPNTVAFHTLGCKLNFSETSSIQRKFEEAGFGINKFEEPADVYIINTCSVTEFADRKCRKVVRDSLKRNPEAKVVMIGCYAQLKPKEISEIPGVDLVLGAAEKFNVLNYIDELSQAPEKGLIKSCEISEVNDFESSFSFGDRTRSFLKVQDGCDYKCSFCTIPQARGKSRSDTINNVVRKANHIAALGVKEIVLTGVNIGDFGLTPTKNTVSREHNFLDLITALDNVDGIDRFRISSIEPNLCSDEIIRFVAQSRRFVPHFHMPLQSGSNDMLKAMRRRYKKELYAERVALIKSIMPHCCIGVDVIVGFPLETEAHFQETFDFIHDLDISYLHVFTFSERAKTPAAEMSPQIPMDIRRERNKRLRILSDKKKRAFYQQHVHDTRTVLFETSKKEGVMTGFTDNYIKLELPLKEELINSIIEVELKEEIMLNF